MLLASAGINWLLVLRSWPGWICGVSMSASPDGPILLKGSCCGGAKGCDCRGTWEGERKDAGETVYLSQHGHAQEGCGFLPAAPCSLLLLVADFASQWLTVPRKSWYKSPPGMEERSSNLPGRQSTLCYHHLSIHPQLWAFTCFST